MIRCPIQSIGSFQRGHVYALKHTINIRIHLVLGMEVLLLLISWQLEVK